MTQTPLPADAIVDPDDREVHSVDADAEGAAVDAVDDSAVDDGVDDAVLDDAVVDDAVVDDAVVDDAVVDDAVVDDAVAGDAVVDEADDGADDAEGEPRSRGDRHEVLVAEGDAAGDYLERLLDILDYDGDIDLDVEGERAVVSIIGDGDIGNLVGERGEVLDALQELTRLAATAETGQRSRLMLDIAGYRAQRRVELADLGVQTAQRVLAEGEPVKLSPMNPFERKVVHDAVAGVDGVSSSSEGEEPRRRVVVSLAS